MGFIRKDYEIKDLGIIIPTAYAKISNVHIDSQGNAYASFEIQQSRNDIAIKNSLENIYLFKLIDKTQPIYAQLYIAAKEEFFADWEDDIVE